MRPAEAGDVDLLYTWSNDPEVRAQSFSGKTIEYEEHTRWFARKLASNDARIMIALDEEAPAAVVRFERSAGECTVSITVAKEYRGKGWATEILRKALKRMRAEQFCGVATAYIKHRNPASLKAFHSAGFKQIENTELGRFPESAKLVFDLSSCK